MTFQEIIFSLQQFWSSKGCIIGNPYDIEKGAGTFNPNTFLMSLGPEPWNVAYVEPSRRPKDGRYGDNPNRVYQHHQFQVIMKPSPTNIQELYLESLRVLGIEPEKHDIRFVEDDWESPTLGAWGLGWEVWLDGMEITQFTYFQQVGGLELDIIPVEITYGLERVALYIQNKENVYDLEWTKGVKYGDMRYQFEFENSKYSFELASLDKHFKWFDDYEEEAKKIGLRHGGTGQKIRPLVACKGTVCLHGNIDTQEICRQLEDKYFGTDTPHKCKIGIVGCANNCAKANINDIGVLGRTVPKFDLDKCVGCGLCVKGCRQKALEVVDRKIVYNKDLCVSCGECVRLCRTKGAVAKEKGAEIFVGGRFGRAMRIGDSLGKIFKEEEVVPMIDKIMDYYKEVGIKGERISHVMDRIGKDEFIKAVLE